MSVHIWYAAKFTSPSFTVKNINYATPTGQQSPKNHSDKETVQKKTQLFDIIHGVQHKRYLKVSHILGKNSLIRLGMLPCSIVIEK